MQLLESLTASLGQALSTKPAFAPVREERAPAGGAAADRARAARTWTVDTGLDGDIALADVPQPVQAVSSAIPPVIQTTPIAMPIDPAIYRNPRGPANPNGSLLPLYTFRELVNPVPAFTRYYSPGPVTTESAYANLLAGAFVPDASSTFAQQVLANAQQQFSASALPPLDGTPTNPWHPVYADPPNWFDVDVTQYKPLSLDAGAFAPSGSFTLLPEAGAAPLAWRVTAGGGATSAPLDPATQILSASMRYLMVSVSRPWLDFTVFQLRGWALAGQAPGFYSTGDATSNDGVMPLIPTTIILATDASVTAQFGPRDRALLKSAADSGTSVALGPIPLRIDGGAIDDAAAGATMTIGSSLPFIVAWVSALVPLAPAMKDPRVS